MQTNEPLDKDDAQAVTQLCRRYGTYRVLCEILRSGQKEAADMHADAVIKRDLPVLERAIAQMRKLHPLRLLTEGE